MGIASQTATGMMNAVSFQKLQESEEALRKSHDELEMRVEQRTKELTSEIAERRFAEKQKDMLLKEVHHRVKNNLQIVSSLLNLTSRRSDNEQTFNALSAAQAKVHSMAIIHTQLYQSERFDKIDMGLHVQELVNNLAGIYGRNKHITTTINASGILLPVVQAIPCALVLNELISNAYKYAFGEGQKGAIKVKGELFSDETVLFGVKDDGVGIPEHIDIHEIDSLGLKLVRNLVLEQLNGNLDIQRSFGNEVIIRFKIFKEDKHEKKNTDR